MIVNQMLVRFSCGDTFVALPSPPPATREGEFSVVANETLVIARITSVGTRLAPSTSRHAVEAHGSCGSSHEHAYAPPVRQHTVAIFSRSVTLAAAASP